MDVPSGIEIDLDLIEKEMQRRKPGQSSIVTQRKEEDSVTFYSGIFEGKTTGTPIGFLIHNKDQKSKDYSHIKTPTDLHMQIMFMKKNMVTETIEEEEEVQHVKLLAELLQVQLLNKS